MDYFTRLKNTVTNALPGNPVTREFEICQHRASYGPGLLWKVYDGYKKSTKQASTGSNTNSDGRPASGPRPPLNKKFFPVDCPSGFKRTDWDFF